MWNLLHDKFKWMTRSMYVCMHESEYREYVWVLCSSAFYDDSRYRRTGKIHQFYLVLYISMLPNKNICLEIVTCNNPIGSRNSGVICLLKTNLVSDWLVKIWLLCLAVFFVHYISNVLFLAMMKLRFYYHYNRTWMVIIQRPRSEIGYWKGTCSKKYAGVIK